MSGRLGNEEVVELALAALGRRSGEVFLREASSSSIEIKDGAIDAVIQRGERGLGVRVLEGGRSGSASTSDLSPEGVGRCVETAFAMAAVSEPDPDASLATEAVLPVDLEIHERRIERPVAERGALALAVEAAARARDGRISGFRKTSYGDGESATHLATTAGARGSYRETHYGLSTSVVATAGAERQIGYHGQSTRRFGDLDPAPIGQKAADLAIGKLGPRPFATQLLPVILDPWMGMALLGAIGRLFSAEAVVKGKSLFAGRIGSAIASDRITIVDDGRLPGGMRTAPFDGEGTPTSKRVLVENGVLRAYLTDRRSARRLGAVSAGNARRGGIGGTPRIGVSNFTLAAGHEEPEIIVRNAPRALRITSLLNLHTIDPISGEFSLGATADYLEHGTRAHPVQGITIAGNLTALLAGIVAVGGDLIIGPGGIGSPTLVIGELSVGGA